MAEGPMRIAREISGCAMLGCETKPEGADAEEPRPRQTVHPIGCLHARSLRGGSTLAGACRWTFGALA